MNPRFVRNLTFRIFGFGIGAFYLLATASMAFDHTVERSTIEPLDDKNRVRLQAQREIVATLARRHVGNNIFGNTKSDLRILQQLFDRYPRRDRRLSNFKGGANSDNERIYEIQALGVVLGDVMARDFDLEWVVFEDQHGRGRALNVKGTKDLVFPVTMLSKLYEVSLPADVRALYEEVKTTLAISSEKSDRRTLPARPTTHEQ